MGGGQWLPEGRAIRAVSRIGTVGSVRYWDAASFFVDLRRRPCYCCPIKMAKRRSVGARRPRQLRLPEPRTWGGRRKGAGRKPRAPGRPGIPHRGRPGHKQREPLHLTLRAREGLPSLRRPGLFQAIQASISRAQKTTFRIVHFSAQRDHLHLMVEASDAAAVTAGASGLAIRTARAINKALGRAGSVWADRYHARALETPREVRNALVYIMMNIRKHDRTPCDGLDPCSSARWFDGFRDRAPPATSATSVQAPPICPPRTWLATTGWRRHGLLSTTEAPRARA
jgi:putative transposase